MSVISYKCPNCDGDLRFEPESQSYRCSYCTSLFTAEELDEMKPASSSEQKDSTSVETEDINEQEPLQDVEQKSENEKNNSDDPEAMIYTCPSCGAQIATTKTTAATFCYYCHNPVVLEGRLSGEMLPDKIIPFRISKYDALNKFKEEVSKKRFVPKDFYSEKQIESITGVYFPFWMIDAKIEGNLTGDGKKIRTWVAGDEEFTETSFFDVARRGTASFCNYLKNALKENNESLVEGVLPYNDAMMEPFSTRFLAGFFAQKRDIEKAEILPEIENELKKDAEKLFREDMESYSHVKILENDFQVADTHARYVLLPVWTITYKDRRGKIYYYSMNGHNGTVCGKYPINHGKLWGLGAIIMAAVTGIMMIGGLFL